MVNVTINMAYIRILWVSFLILNTGVDKCPNGTSLKKLGIQSPTDICFW